jgi:hypothetical protein
MRAASSDEEIATSRPHRIMKSLAVTLIVMICTLPGPALAQNNGAIEGTITDEQGGAGTGAFS